MSYGSTIAVEDAEDEWREETARVIAMHAAELVAARDMTREAAITAAVEHQRYLYCRKNTKPSVSSHKTLFFRELSSAKTEEFFVLKPENLLQNLYANLH